jgi:ATP-dependent Clp protease ATP-binding subunit ClpA
LKRLIQTRVETPVARLVVAGTIKGGQAVKVGVKKGELDIQVE